MDLRSPSTLLLQGTQDPIPTSVVDATMEEQISPAEELRVDTPQDNKTSCPSSPTSILDATMEEQTSPAKELLVDTLFRQATQDDGTYCSLSSDVDEQQSAAKEVAAAMEEQESPAKELLVDTLLRQATRDDGTYCSFSSDDVDATMEEQESAAAKELSVDTPYLQGMQDHIPPDAAGGGVGGDGGSSSPTAMMVVAIDNKWSRCTVCSRVFSPPKFQLACGHPACVDCRAGQCRKCAPSGASLFPGGSCRNAVVESRISVSPRSPLADCSSDGCYDEMFDCKTNAEPLPASALSNLDARDMSMLDCSSDGDGVEKFNCETDAEPLPASALSNLDAPDLSILDADMSHGEPPSSCLDDQYVGKGFPKEIGNNAANTLHELLLKYKERGDYTLEGDPSTSGCTTVNVEDDDYDDLDFLNRDEDDDHIGVREVNSYGPIDENFPKLEVDKKIKFIVDQGFSKDEANMIITRIGMDPPFFVFVDSEYEAPKISFGVMNKARFKEESKKKRKYYGGREQGNQAPVDGSYDEPMTFQNPMVGFNLPGYTVSSQRRKKLSKLADGPRFFYYENVAQAPKGVWRTISEKLYNVEPELVDSINLCAAARKRGYIHNLPIKNRKSLLPVAPKTIFEAFPHYKKWWPLWDTRSKLNCLSTHIPSTKLSELIERVLGRANNTPSLRVQKDIIDVCKKFNLVWVGKNKVASLEANEMECVLGFPNDHTRVVGITKRYKSLGNSFQVDTVAYHLSVLRDIFPDGIKVLSLFSGIGGAEVALHSLGIKLKIVVSVEICKVNRRILRGWWNQTQEEGELIEVPDVHNLTDDVVEYLTLKFRGFDLVIGGSPCNNLAGRNRFHRDGLEGKQSVLFYHYFRILDVVKSVMARM